MIAVYFNFLDSKQIQVEDVLNAVMLFPDEWLDFSSGDSEQMENFYELLMTNEIPQAELNRLKNDYFKNKQIILLFLIKQSQFFDIIDLIKTEYLHKNSESSLKILIRFYKIFSVLELQRENINKFIKNENNNVS